MWKWAIWTCSAIGQWRQTRYWCIRSYDVYEENAAREDGVIMEGMEQVTE